MAGMPPVLHGAPVPLHGLPPGPGPGPAPPPVHGAPPVPGPVAPPVHGAPPVHAPAVPQHLTAAVVQQAVQLAVNGIPPQLLTLNAARAPETSLWVRAVKFATARGTTGEGMQDLIGNTANWVGTNQASGAQFSQEVLSHIGLSQHDQHLSSISHAATGMSEHTNDAAQISGVVLGGINALATGYGHGKEIIHAVKKELVRAYQLEQQARNGGLPAQQAQELHALAKEICKDALVSLGDHTAGLMVSTAYGVNVSATISGMIATATEATEVATHASDVATGALGAATGLSALTGTLGMLRSGYATYQAVDHRLDARNVLQDPFPLHPEMQAVFEHLESSQDILYKILKTSKNGLAAASGAATVAAVFGATGATPVGWILGGTAATGALGLGCYKLGCRSYQHYLEDGLVAQRRTIQQYKLNIQQAPQNLANAQARDQALGLQIQQLNQQHQLNLHNAMPASLLQVQQTQQHLQQLQQDLPQRQQQLAQAQGQWDNLNQALQGQQRQQLQAQQQVQTLMQQIQGMPSLMQTQQQLQLLNAQPMPLTAPQQAQLQGLQNTIQQIGQAQQALGLAQNQEQQFQQQVQQTQGLLAPAQNQLQQCRQQLQQTQHAIPQAQVQHRLSQAQHQHLQNQIQQEQQTLQALQQEQGEVQQMIQDFNNHLPPAAQAQVLQQLTQIEEQTRQSLLAVRELGAIADTILEHLGPGPVQMGPGPHPVPQYTTPEKALVQLGLEPDRIRAARPEDAHEFIVRNLADQRF